MTTLLLGGGSLKNQTWIVDEVKPKLEPDFPCTPLIYENWERGQDVSEMDFEKELQKCLRLVGNQSFNLVAKSVGSVLGMKLLKSDGINANKIIVCGVPLKDFSPEELEIYDVLKTFDPKNILCIQNSQDPHGSYAEAKLFISKINPQILAIEKIGDSHSYPYYDEFKAFLSR